MVGVTVLGLAVEVGVGVVVVTGVTALVAGGLAAATCWICI